MPCTASIPAVTSATLYNGQFFQQDDHDNPAILDEVSDIFIRRPIMTMLVMIADSMKMRGSSG